MAEIDWTEPLETTRGEPVEYHGLALGSCRPSGDAKHIVMFETDGGEKVVWFVTRLGKVRLPDGYLFTASVRNVPPPERWAVLHVKPGRVGSDVSAFAYSNKQSADRGAQELISQGGGDSVVYIAKLEPVEADDG